MNSFSPFISEFYDLLLLLKPLLLRGDWVAVFIFFSISLSLSKALNLSEFSMSFSSFRSWSSLSTMQLCLTF